MSGKVFEAKVTELSDTDLLSAAVGAGGPGPGSSTPDWPPLEQVIVAIHGIGSQLRSDTIRSVASQFGASAQPPLPVMPLGYFNLGKVGEVRVSRLLADASHPLSRIGFAEIYWADIPGQVVKANDTLEETKAWGRTVVSRARSCYMKEVPGGKLTQEDFELGVGVVEEIVETVAVLENLFFLADKAGLFKFELAPLLRDFVGDVQLVTDFPYYRSKIVFRFHDALTRIVETFKSLYPGAAPKIHIVAHSEGTVISLLGLLEALSGIVIDNPDDPKAAKLDTSWIRCVHGYMTIGSPIDKHLVLWPSLWEGRLNLASQVRSNGEVLFGDPTHPRLTLPQQIKWRNYYDFGDPIGFQLNTARDVLNNARCKAFSFAPKDDFGFSRYWLPGKAHTDYWNDAEVFGHFIADVVMPQEGKPATAPTSSAVRDKVSLAIPYVATYALHYLAAFVLFKAVTAGFDDAPSASLFERLTLHIVLLGGLLMSITFAARLPRLVKADGIRWHLAALAGFAIAAAPCAWFLPYDIALYLASPMVALFSSLDNSSPTVGRIVLVILAALIATSGWVVPRKPKVGRYALMACGCLILATIVVVQIGEGVTKASWPTVVGGAMFLYLWWLGILVFDLTFIWHRYIRRSVAVETLLQWRHHKDAQPHQYMGLGKPEPGSP